MKLITFFCFVRVKSQKSFAFLHLFEQQQSTEQDTDSLTLCKLAQSDQIFPVALSAAT